MLDDRKKKVLQAIVEEYIWIIWMGIYIILEIMLLD